MDRTLAKAFSNTFLIMHLKHIIVNAEMTYNSFKSNDLFYFILALMNYYYTVLSFL